MFKNIQNKIANYLSKPNNNSRVDGYSSVFTNLGTKRSRTNSTFFRPTLSLDQYTLAEIYKSNGIGKRIVNILVDDAIRGFIEADKLLLKELYRVKAKQAIIDAGCFGRLYGGALLVAFVDDEQEFDKPLNLNRIQQLISLKVFDRHQIYWNDDDLCNDFYKEYYGEPELFTITNNWNGLSDISFKVHRSRCCIFGGDKIPNSLRVNNQGWDVSVLQSCCESIRNYNLVNTSSVEIIQDFVQVILKLNGLAQKMAAGEEVKASLNERIDLIDKTRSVSNSIILDGSGTEDYEKKASSVSGLADLWDRFSENICAVTGIPATRLFGKSPGGLNATGASDLQNWYDIVRAYRGDQIEPCINWLLDILKSQKSWTDKPKVWEWEFPSLTAPSELEWAEIKKKYAETDAIYMDRGAIDPIECWQERFGRGEFHVNIKLSKPEPEELIEIDDDNADLLAVEKNNEEDKESKEDKEVKDIVRNTYKKLKNG
ncbi:DUF1073 domain-containing phage-related protein (plasmid) [Candidatus Trichorickettsia mobilis]|uniref:DUF1073 domain-containing phage-related protein n=1 Tax=Candidatus Trichorickettsia mobilis TaxID=1346319 RepID=A0ABZ0UU07_9RICK|nr:DUF1073 domain-containing protein [Candidatus Trichorickettsia mobilis]WPY01515.1 DUF1073 domain-containing phage-related protein [Candidatus Trichorickettsia mobilis]